MYYIKKYIDFGDSETKKHKSHQYKRPISIKNIDVNIKGVPSKVSFSKKGFKYFLAKKMFKKLDFYKYFFKKGVHIK